MTVKVLIIGTGFYNNHLRDSLLRVLDITLISHNSNSYSGIQQIGNPEELPLIFIGNSSGLSPTDIINLNKDGYVLAYTLESPSLLNQLNLIVNLRTNAYHYVINNLNTYSNDYFEYMNDSRLQIPLYSPYSTYFYYTHPQLKPALYLNSSEEVRIGVLEKLETTTGVLPTPILVAPVLDKVPVSQNTDLVYKDIISFAKNFTNPPYNVSGLVLDFNKEPIERDIAVYSTTTNRLVGKSRSKEDGTYWVGLTKDEPVYVVAIPEENNNALIKYNIKPVPSY